MYWLCQNTRCVHYWMHFNRLHNISLTHFGDIGSFEDGEIGAVPSLLLEGSLALLSTHLLCNLQGHNQVDVLSADVDPLTGSVKQLEAVFNRSCAGAATHAHKHPPHNHHRPTERKYNVTLLTHWNNGELVKNTGGNILIYQHLLLDDTCTNRAETRNDAPQKPGQ